MALLSVTSPRWAAKIQAFSENVGPQGADGSGVQITDLEAGGWFLLADTTRPEQGVAVGGKLRRVTTRYPGVTRPSTQILGAEEEPIVLEGWFRDSWIGKDGGAAAMATAMRAAWRKRHYCELFWGQALVRRGYIDQITETYTSERAIRYRIVFEVVETDESAVLATPFAPVETPFDLLALIREIEDVVDTLSTTTAELDNVITAIV
jgi:hypothetical protein